MAKDAMFNLTAFADRLVKEDRKPEVARKIKAAVDARSIEVDLMLAREASEALTFSFDNPMNQPQQFREISEAALMSYALILYARATKSTSRIRKQYDPISSFTSSELKVHKELCDLRDHAIAHFGKGGSYVGNWVIEIAILDIADGVMKPAVVTRRQIVDRGLAARAHVQIGRALEIIQPVAVNRINAFTEALNVECSTDPEFYREILQHPLNPELFLGGEDQVEKLRQGRTQGQARSTFGHR